MNYKQLETLLAFLRATAQNHGTQEVTCICGYIGLPSGTLKTDVVEVKASLDCLMLEIMRLENMNPVVQVSAEGKIIRTHGEFRYVQEAVIGILTTHGFTGRTLMAHGIPLNP